MYDDEGVTEYDVQRPGEFPHWATIDARTRPIPGMQVQCAIPRALAPITQTQAQVAQAPEAPRQPSPAVALPSAAAAREEHFSVFGFDDHAMYLLLMIVWILVIVVSNVMQYGMLRKIRSGQKKMLAYLAKA